MPKVWLNYEPDDRVYYLDTFPDGPNAVEVEMNGSLYRQIVAAERKFYKFQMKIAQWHEEVSAGKLKRITGNHGKPA